MRLAPEFHWVLDCTRWEGQQCLKPPGKGREQVMGFVTPSQQVILQVLPTAANQLRVITLTEAVRWGPRLAE